MTNPHRPSPTGFTLIEVVVALAVVAVTLTAIGAVAATSARGTRSLEQHLTLVETTRIVAATLPRNPQGSLDGLTGEILGHRWRISLAPFIGSGAELHVRARQWGLAGLCRSTLFSQESGAN